MFSVGDSRNKCSYVLAGSRGTFGKVWRHNGHQCREKGRQAARTSQANLLLIRLPASGPTCLQILALAHPDLPFQPKPLSPTLYTQHGSLSSTLYCYVVISSQPLKHLDSPNSPLTPPPFTCQGFVLSSGQVGKVSWCSIRVAGSPPILP